MNAQPDAGNDPRQMLDLITATRRATVRRMTGRYVGLLVLWAVALGVGFAALWVTTGVGAFDLLPTVAGWIVFAGSLLIAIVWSTIVGISAARDGIRGRSQLQGALYGCSWTIVMLGAWGLLGGLQRHGLPDEFAQLLYPGLYIFLVGTLYLAGGALWRAVPMYVLGAALIVSVVVATFVGAPNHYLVYAIAAPAALLVTAGVLHWGPLMPDPAEAS